MKIIHTHTGKINNHNFPNSKYYKTKYCILQGICIYIFMYKTSLNQPLFWFYKKTEKHIS